MMPFLLCAVSILMLGPAADAFTMSVRPSSSAQQRRSIATSASLQSRGDFLNQIVGAGVAAVAAASAVAAAPLPAVAASSEGSVFRFLYQIRMVLPSTFSDPLLPCRWIEFFQMMYAA